MTNEAKEHMTRSHEETGNHMTMMKFKRHGNMNAETSTCFRIGLVDVS